MEKCDELERNRSVLLQLGYHIYISMPSDHEDQAQGRDSLNGLSRYFECPRIINAGRMPHKLDAFGLSECETA